jgi:hypothetical protein
VRIVAAVVVLGICLAATCMLWPTLVPTRAGDMFFVLHDHGVTEIAAHALRAAIVLMWVIAVVVIARRPQK